jgi:hypothetical protein
VAWSLMNYCVLQCGPLALRPRQKPWGSIIKRSKKSDVKCISLCNLSRKYAILLHVSRGESFGACAIRMFRGNDKWTASNYCSDTVFREQERRKFLSLARLLKVHKIENSALMKLVRKMTPYTNKKRHTKTQTLIHVSWKHSCKACTFQPTRWKWFICIW